MTYYRYKKCTIMHNYFINVRKINKLKNVI